MSLPLDAPQLLPPFVLPSRRDYRIAEKIVDSHPVISAYGSIEWAEFDDDGRQWAAAIIREAQAQVRLNAEQLVQANIFLGWMADRFRERTARRVLGFSWPTMSRQVAMECALPVFDAFITDWLPFGDPAGAWDRGAAEEIVDEELRHWEG